MSDLVGNPEAQFSYNEAHISYIISEEISDLCNNIKSSGIIISGVTRFCQSSLKWKIIYCIENVILKLFPPIIGPKCRIYDIIVKAIVKFKDRSSCET